MQELRTYRRLCDERGIALVEDCAHAWFGERDGFAVGTVGDYAIASLWKFFPVKEGGLLASARRELNGVPQRLPDFRHSLKSLLNTLEQAWEYNRLRSLHVLGRPLLDAAQSLRRRRCRFADDSADGAMTELPLGSPSFDDRSVGVSLSPLLRAIARRVDRLRIVERRREHYMRIAEGLATLPGTRLLFPQLPERTVPYVVPVLVEDPARRFMEWKRRGVPIIRFGEELAEDLPPDRCSVTRLYQRALFQFPCHQELRDSEITWMLQQLQRTS